MNLKENECNQYRADADASKLNFWLVSLISKLPYYSTGRPANICQFQDLTNHGYGSLILNSL